MAAMTGGRDEFAVLLRRAGLEIVGDWRVEEVLPPRSAWRRVIAFGTEPAVSVRSERSDLADEVDRQWHRLASEAGVLAGDGTFLISVAGNWTHAVSEFWTRVRLTDSWRLAAVLGERPGQPEFVTLSMDGGALVAATTEEYDVWLIAENRLKERQEDEARAAGRETPQERADAWASLFAGPAPTEKLLAAWARGLARNRAAPLDLRVRLMEKDPYVLYSPLPADVVDAVLAHPDWKLRELAAEFQPDVTPDQWARLIRGEHDERHRWILAMVAADRRAELTEDSYRELATDPSARVRAEAARHRNLPPSLLVALAADPEATVRAAACPSAWPHLDAAGRTALLGDPAGEVRAQARLLHHREHPLPRAVYEARDLEPDALESCRLERELAAHLARHGGRSERLALARNPRLDPDLVALLGDDPDDGVRFAVSTRADLTETQREGIRIDFDPGVHYHTLDWVEALHHDDEAMRRLSASAHPLVRRSVARARRLPADVVARLARDDDRVVQLFLAECCDDAPADMLLRVWQWWTGSLTVPDRPRSHPHFPRSDLLRYVDDPNPRMRRLALDDPDSTPDVVERLSRDPSAEVRCRAVYDPRLPPAAAARLTEDAHEHIRNAATVHPRLPARVLARLLRDTRTADTAAESRALPVEVMRRMVEHVEGAPPTGPGRVSGACSSAPGEVR